MLLQSSNQVNLLVSGLQGLLSRGTLLDLTLAAGGKTIRAHRVVLASASKYFEVRFHLQIYQYYKISFVDLSILQDFICRLINITRFHLQIFQYYKFSFVDFSILQVLFNNDIQLAQEYLPVNKVSAYSTEKGIESLPQTLLF